MYQNCLLLALKQMQELVSLDTSTATGPDGLGNRVLKETASTCTLVFPLSFKFFIPILFQQMPLSFHLESSQCPPYL